MDQAELAFDQGFHAVTGETGAGKSVLLGALAILAGNRVEKSIIRAGTEACVVEASIYVGHGAGDEIRTWLSDNEFPECEEDTLVLNRALFMKKAARVSINGRLTTLGKLRELGDLWIDFHGPGEPQKLIDEGFQRTMVDSYGSCKEPLDAYGTAFEKWRSYQREIENLRAHEQLDEDELAYLNAQLAKLNSIDLSVEGIEELEAAYRRVNQAQEITAAAQACYEALQGSGGAVEGLSLVLSSAAELTAMEADASQLEDRISSLILEMEDLALEYRARIDSADFEPSEVEELQRAMRHWMDLRRKYGGDLESVIEARETMSRRIGDQGNIEGRLIELEAKASRSLSEAQEAAKALSAARSSSARRLEAEVSTVLKTLGFKKADLPIKIHTDGKLTESGADRVEFLFSANPGSDPLPLNQIASSGEMARVMLALKTLLARFDKTPVLVFDEVDANVGGEIGKSVGDRLKELAQDHQVFCITHLPQVAAKGGFHWCVSKEQSDHATSIKISELTDLRSTRLSELARMMGDRDSKTALSHAEELLQ